MTIKIGDKLPNATFRLVTPDGPKPVTTQDYFAGRRIVLAGGPGGESLVYVNGRESGAFSWGRDTVPLTPRARAGDTFTLLLDAQIGGLVSFEQAIDQVLAKLINEGRQNIPGVLNLLIECQAEAQAEFGVIFEQAVGPGRTASFLVDRIWSGWQVSAVD